MPEAGYYQYPTIYKDRIVFVCEDDLWSVPSKGGQAHRLTAAHGPCSQPAFSPDGTLIAYVGKDEGHAEIHLLELATGLTSRLTYLGGDTHCVGWSRDGQRVLYSTNAGSPFGRSRYLGEVSIEGGLGEPLGLGPAAALSYGPKKGQVLGRHTYDPARWKRYRGGTAGQIWVDPSEENRFHRLVRLDGNLTRPVWVGRRIYFGSDHLGVCNLFSCTPEGEDLRQHTRHRKFYLRHPSTDGRQIVYQCGADLYHFEPTTEKSRKLKIHFQSSRPKLLRRFVSGAAFMESYRPSSDGASLAVTSRGRIYTFNNWEGPVRQVGRRDGVRYRLVRHLPDGLVFVSDQEGEEHLYRWNEKKDETVRLELEHDLGRGLLADVSPDGKKLLLTNHRFELLLINLEEPSSTLIEQSRHSRIGGVCWSPDSRFAAYSFSISRQDAVIKIYSLEEGTSQAVTTPSFYDYGPAFDPDGRYLYFFSCRDFNPVRDNLFFELSFPEGVKPYLVTLRTHLPNPFEPLPRAPGADPEFPETEPGATDKDKDEKAKKKKKGEVDPITIDFEGIEHRQVAFPVAEGRYYHMAPVGNGVLYLRYPVEGTLTRKPSRVPRAIAQLYHFDFKSLESTQWVNGVTDMRLSQDTKTLAYRVGYRLRMISTSKKPSGNETSPSRKSGYVNLGRVRPSVLPMAEWKQMFAEAWRLMRDHFWDAGMGGADWRAIYQQYLPLLDRVSTRSEFSDLLWEFQGELGTSHAYEYGGDYRPRPHYPLGKLAADFRWDRRSKAYRILHVPRGDCWAEGQDSPLNRVEVALRPGDMIYRVNGQRLSERHGPQEFLVHLAGQEVLFEVRRQGSRKRETVALKVLSAETPVRYRHWVEENRRRVHELSAGRVGYIHVPNMGNDGYAEFHRSYFSEMEKEGLVIDVRYNGGGNVSQLLLEKLARKRLGFDIPRWGEPIPYPQDSPQGPMVALTNEQAGSDGDIFSHAFKLLRLGPLIGTRTWGGVIGIWPRHALVDGTTTTQPEFAYWFEDVGWTVENYGTDPDEVVEIAPQDWLANRDPQLERAVERAVEIIETQPPLKFDP